MDALSRAMDELHLLPVLSNLLRDGGEKSANLKAVSGPADCGKRRRPQNVFSADILTDDDRRDAIWRRVCSKREISAVKRERVRTRENGRHGKERRVSEGSDATVRDGLLPREEMGEKSIRSFPRMSER